MSQPDPFRSVYSSNLPAMLDHFGISLKVILVRSDGGGINTHFRSFHKPMGIATVGRRLLVLPQHAGGSTQVGAERQARRLLHFENTGS